MISRLNNLKLSSKSFSGSGEVVMSMGSGTGSSYNYTLEGSVNESKVLTLKTNVDIPTPMGENGNRVHARRNTDNL